MTGQMWPEHRYHLIPTMSWAEEDTFKFCFDGIVAVSSVGVMRNLEALDIFKTGMQEMIEVVELTKIIFYGKPMAELCNGIDFVCFSNKNQQRLSDIGRK